MGQFTRCLLRLAGNGRFPLMIDWQQCSAVERKLDKLGGAWVFKGTRVPVRALFENLQAGASIEDFLAWFPGVAAEQAKAVLQHCADESLAAA